MNLFLYALGSYITVVDVLQVGGNDLNPYIIPNDTNMYHYITKIVNKIEYHTTRLPDKSMIR